MRQKIALVRHMFPSVSLETIDDEEFAMISNEAEWLFSKQLQYSVGSLMGGMPSGSKSKQAPKRGSAPNRR